MNIEKLKKLKEWILAEPRRYNQSFWIDGKGSKAVTEQKPPCGTTACLAGSACLMEGYKPKFIMNNEAMGAYSVVFPNTSETFLIDEEAMEILGLTARQAYYLFKREASGWSAAARDAFYAAHDVLEKAQAAAMQIDYMIEHQRVNESI